MRPHRLRVTAFGPFAEAVEVDLDALAGSGLFLLHGETGAGKTTLLDALGFALFGQVPGVRQGAKRLRSDHASPATRTEVQLEVTLGGRRMRVTRSPEQERAKLRGTGTTKEPAKVLLEEREGSGWRCVSTRVGEADAELADLVGMSAQQFFQVVLLPQGDFARFLRAGSDERAALLERLFATDRFRSVEHWLAERRRATTTARDAARDVVARLAARVAQAAGVEEPDDVAEVWAPSLASAAAQAAQAAADQALREQAALDQALAADEQTRLLADRQARRRAALAEQQRLLAEADTVAALHDELDAARRSAEMATVLDDAAARARQLRQASEAQVRVQEQLPTALRSADGPLLRAARDDLAGRAGRLDAVRADADRAATEEAAAGEADAAAARAQTEAKRLRTELEQVPAQRQRAEELRAAAQTASVRLPAVQARLEQRRATAADARALAEASSQLEALRARHLAARERAADAREQAQALREARFDGMVAELAATLVDGTPCLVCGSLEHPDPSQIEGRRVSRDDEEAAASGADRLRTHAEQLGAEVAALEAQCVQLRARVGDAGVAELTADVAALAAELETLTTSAAALDGAEQAVAALDDRATALAARLAALDAECVAARGEAAAARARAGDACAVVAALLDGADDLDTAVTVVRASVDAVDAALDAAERSAAARREAQRAEQQAIVAARAAGFVDVDDAEAARRDADWRAAATARTTAHREALLAVEAVLRERDLDVALDPPADAGATASVVEAARARHAAAVHARGRLGDRAAQLAALAPQLAQAVADLVPLTARAAEVRTLADLTAGQGGNTLRMTLSAYVLAARLEEVAAVASERLLRMTQGRYTLVHTDAGRGNAKAGLGLLVRDTWTGQDRDTSTLSGGETFLASLALALGLADVVAAEAGGARTEALFVDEGFGTLDEQALEEVMDVLDGLREGGRVVGVVSHVAELRQRIPAQVHVRKGRAGSDVALLGC
jgi:exonuclease SbcC